jgi:hypothetical protein
MNLPTRDYLFYCGIDPGFSGAIGLMNAAGTMMRVWDLPVIEAEKQRQREFDLSGFDAIFRTLCRFPGVAVGIEWPTTRPSEGAERCERFGRGKGYLEAFAFLKGLDYFKIAPNLWKGRLGLDGKEVAGANDRAAAMFDMYYPEYRGLIRGPRGGILDGRMDALLIAHFVRTMSGAGMKSVADRFGRDSVEAFALRMGGGRRTHKMRNLRAHQFDD